MMKNKKSLLWVALVVCVLILGVGYAVVSSVGLDITGSAKVADSTLKVAFNGETSVSDSGKVVAEAEDDTLTASITVTGLSKVGDSVTATYTIKNEETDLDASYIVDPEKGIENDQEDYFTVTTDVDDVAKTISANGTNTVTVTVTLKAIPVDKDNSTANIKVNLAASAVEK